MAQNIAFQFNFSDFGLIKTISYAWLGNRVFCNSVSCIKTIGSEFCETLASATMLGAMEMGKESAILAGLAIVFLSTEKTLLFREKWKHHLRSVTALEILKLKFDSETSDIEKIKAELIKVLQAYASELLIAERE